MVPQPASSQLHFTLPSVACSLEDLVLPLSRLERIYSLHLHHDQVIRLRRLRRLFDSLPDVSLLATAEVLSRRRPRVRLSRPSQAPCNRLLGLLCDLLVLLGWLLRVEQERPQPLICRLCHLGILRRTHRPLYRHGHALGQGYQQVPQARL